MSIPVCPKELVGVTIPDFVCMTDEQVAALSDQSIRRIKFCMSILNSASRDGATKELLLTLNAANFIVTREIIKRGITR